MKSKFTYMGLMALVVSACGTGSYVTNSYTDDIYFSPSEVKPPIVVSDTKSSLSTKSAGDVKVVNEIADDEYDSEISEDYMTEGTMANAADYNAEQGFEGPDTITYYEDGEMKQLIDNYYTDDDDNVDFAYRIQRFHNPTFYDPFYWDSWYYDPFYYDPWGWSFSYNFGWGYPYYGWGSPYYSWGNPYYSWGYGYPYYSWGYYPSYWGGGYYNWHHGNYNPIYRDSDNYRYGRRSEANTNISRSAIRDGSNSTRTSVRDINAVSNETRVGTGSSRREGSVSSGTRAAQSAERSAINSGRGSSNVITERRRNADGTSGYSRQATVNGEQQTDRMKSYTRPGNSSQNRTYTRPGNSVSGNNLQPRVVNKSSSTGTQQGYAQPKSSSNYNQSYRSSSTYNRSSSSGVSSRSYSAPSVNRSDNSYRGSSSGSSSGSYSSGSSSRSSSGSYSSGSSGVSRSSGSSSGGSSSGSSSGGSSSRGGGGGRR